MQPTNNKLSENGGSQFVELRNKHLAAAFDLHAQVKQAQTRITAHIGADSAASELHDRIEIWLNEGGAGGEDGESTTRPRGGR